jgi:hypothetical protein
MLQRFAALRTPRLGAVSKNSSGCETEPQTGNTRLAPPFDR